jgi:two-component system, OmpR family, sensor histidine kinase MprB
MTLRARIVAVAGLAVALGVLGAAVTVYVAVRSDLRGQVDGYLRQRAQIFTGIGSQVPPAAFAHAGLPRGAKLPAGFPRAVKPPRFGAASGYVQLVFKSGQIFVPGGQGASPTIAPSVQDRAIAARGSGRALSDRTVKGTHLRVITVGAGSLGAVVIALPLTQVDHELREILILLAIVGLAGVAIAAILGALVARTALVPVARFTRRAELLSDTLDLSQRLPVTGHDELARLATSFNHTLDVLERSVQAQRHLVADASHELRTPIAALRGNIQILREADRLPAEDQLSIQEDIIEELDELTSLVSDVVELARETKTESATDAVALDQVVRYAVERTRRRGQLGFELSLESTVIAGEADRINRAVSNLLDNARKWSPADAMVEVGLHEGVLSVRDHGPGFEESDLPFVFDRFYRADRARKLPGSGLGLAIVRQAAEAHGGYARAENAPGGGALLIVSFGARVTHNGRPGPHTSAVA